MAKQSLKVRLLNYLKNNPGWHASGNLQRKVAEKTTYTPQTTGRVLRLLTEEGEVEVKYERNHAHYRARKKLTMEEFWNSI